MPRYLAGVAPLVALLLAACLSFWLSPAPRGQPDVEYWGEYVHLAPGLGFVVNHDSHGYMLVAQEPRRLLLPQEVRQSRPLYALLGAAVGYPLTAALRLAGRHGLVLPFYPEDPRIAGYYAGFVLLNGLALLAGMLLLRHLCRVLTAGRGAAWQFYALAWVLVANPITKAFFWTAHQQMFAFLVPLFCLALALRVGRGWLRGGQLAGLACALGLLPLVYGSFVLAWPALAYGVVRAARLAPAGGRRWRLVATRLLLSGLLFGLPTLLWIALLRTQGTTYYNHEAARFHQLVWLPEAWPLPWPEFTQVVAAKLAAYAASLAVMRWWLLAGLGLLGATWWRLRPRSQPVLPAGTGPALSWVFGCFVVFFALLGYYPERLAYTLLPLVLCLLAGLLPHWPARYARPAVLAGAAGWHLYVLLSYGPFS
ncbi:hypothetical protein QMK33_02825 [Hymenobacter sp. H14-R3]|uniref:hypothetical protein n=1 Tax=Hymenobacter sp. H14-R3 TaxID=3046308 RepID=UPI0024BB8DEA|nr:hypothetical protein [Hymenobacter sp. H14-R3]MDJ0364072.1 hypothetical protein [Hymenobacter sp. H14-R3]